MRTALTIAGSDSGGGAGIQADLKTFAAHGVYGTSAITAVTAQNTIGVMAWEAVSTDLLIAQIEAVADDLAPAAVKTGMLATAAIAEAVAATIASLDLPNLVVDPVSVSKHGHPLLAPDAVDVLRDRILPLAILTTPNLPEAGGLAGFAVETREDMRKAAEAILGFGPRAVLVKGGHLDDSTTPGLVIDVVCTPDREFDLQGPRIETRHTHGTGCTFAAAIAAALALGQPVDEAIRMAREYLEGAIRHAPRLGAGQGPLNHFWRLY